MGRKRYSIPCGCLVEPYDYGDYDVIAWVNPCCSQGHLYGRYYKPNGFADHDEQDCGLQPGMARRAAHNDDPWYYAHPELFDGLSRSLETIRQLIIEHEATNRRKPLVHKVSPGLHRPAGARGWADFDRWAKRWTEI